MQIFSVDGMPGSGKSLFCRTLREQLLLNDYALIRDQILVIEEPQDVGEFLRVYRNEMATFPLTLSYAMESLDTRGWYYIFMKSLVSLINMRTKLTAYRATHGGEDPRVMIIENYNVAFERHLLIPYMSDTFGVTNGEIEMFTTTYSTIHCFFGVTLRVDQINSIYMECPLNVIKSYRNIDRLMDSRMPEEEDYDELYTYIGILEAEANVVCRNTQLNVDNIVTCISDLLNREDFRVYFS